MVSTGDIYCILYDVCKGFGIDDICDGLDDPKGELTAERVVIRTSALSEGSIFDKCFVNINVCVPQNTGGSADTIRLCELERIAEELFKDGGVVYYEENVCRYGVGGDSWLSRESDRDMKCHFVNVRILFEILNVNH